MAQHGMPQDQVVPLAKGREAKAALAAVIRRLSLARSLDEIMTIATYAVRTLIKADGATFILREGDRCYYAEEDAISPLWKGRRFPLNACISGWCMLHRQPAVIPEIGQDPRIPLDAYRPTFVRSLAMVPVGADRPEAALGAYWSEPHQASAEELDLLRLLADAAALAWRAARSEPGLDPAAPAAARRPLQGLLRLPDRIRRLDLRSRGFQAYAFAVVGVLLATLVREVVRASGVTGLAVFSTYYPVVLLSVLVGGRRPGVVASVLGGLAAYYFFMPPLYRFRDLDTADVLNLGLYGGACLLIVVIIDGYKRLVLRLREEDARHLTLAREQAHRVANALSVVEGVVRQSLREEPDRARAINRRLRAALAEVDMRAPRDAAPRSIRAVLTDELQGFDLSRFELAGDDERPLSAQIGGLLALAAHELATNAMKYGGLSTDAGGVVIAWKLGDGRVEVRWREHGGPPVTPPTSRGYGSTLLRRLIEANKGALSLDFRPSGVVAAISLPLAAASR